MTTALNVINLANAPAAEFRAKSPQLLQSLVEHYDMDILEVHEILVYWAARRMAALIPKDELKSDRNTFVARLSKVDEQHAEITSAAQRELARCSAQADEIAQLTESLAALLANLTQP